LALLVRDVRAVAPRPDAAARGRLDARVDGLAGRPSPTRAWRLPRLQVLVPALGAVAAALLAVVLVTRPGDTNEAARTTGAALESSGDSAAGGSSAPQRATPAPAVPGIVAPAAP